MAVEWSALPPEVKQEAYKKLDFISRLEFVKKEGGTLVYRTQNSYDPKEATIKFLPSEDPHKTGAFLLRQFFNRNPHSLIETFEWDLEYFNEKDSCGISWETINILNHFRACKFRIKKLVMDDTTQLDMRKVMSLICDWEILERIESLRLEVDPECLTPRKFFDRTDLFSRTVPFHDSAIWMSDRRGETPGFLAQIAQISTKDCVTTARFAEMDDLCLFDAQNFPATKVNDKVTGKRQLHRNINVVFRYCKSECGFWCHAVKKEYEKLFIDYFKNEKCGLRWLCKKCSDPFEYWYYQNIGRRVLDEPEWLGIVEKPDDEDEAEFLKLKCETMRQEFENNDKKQKKENVQKHVIQKAWGFRTSNSDKNLDEIITEFSQTKISSSSDSASSSALKHDKEEELDSKALRRAEKNKKRSQRNREKLKNKKQIKKAAKKRDSDSTESETSGKLQSEKSEK
ncbi:hypothetical protein GCK72_019797 [Caenorhabditis remanei]|uniref:Uncharacterized protein n=1 Tax=Caenorhabditis remanei TaxID=31234 RepID=A0A6A5GF85_CAERE|nr:hypothetical protein GCK72_019797 [Caenorhabditis remanei]KAF1753241.1 hypothetical protein GCK72_019797 [Caenorhabditis remanei]